MEYQHKESLQNNHAKRVCTLYDEPDFSRYLEGAMNSNEIVLFEEHSLECNDCAAELSRYRRVQVTIEHENQIKRLESRSRDIVTRLLNPKDNDPGKPEMIDKTRSLENSTPDSIIPRGGR